MATNISQISAGTTVLAVRIGGDLYGLPLDAVDEVLPALPIESVPEGPDYLRGVLFVRGQLIPVLDAAKRLGVARDRPLEPPIVCVRLNGRTVGLEVDEALDLVDLDSQPSLPADRIDAGPGVFAAAVEVDGEMIRLLDMRRLLNEDAIRDVAP